MASLVLINDNELRRRLRGHGFRPDGPITDTTREVYFRKLQRLDNATTPPMLAAPASRGRSSRAHVTTLSPTPHRLNIDRYGEYNISPHGATSRGARLPALNHAQSELSTSRQSLSEDAPRNDPIIHGSLGNLFLANYNDSSHATSDVCFMFQDGIVLYESRALLVTCCPQMTQLLYNTTVPFPVSLHTPENGNMIIWCYQDELVRSVKYKIAILKGIPVSNQTLILHEQTLSNDVTLHSCNVRTNSMLVLQVSGSVRPVNLRTASINPSLSITNFSISPFIQAVNYEIPVLPSEITLPAQVAQLVIVSDLTGNLFSEFIRYLYTGTIMVSIESAPTLCALSETFTIPHLQESSLRVVDDNINSENIRGLLSFSHHNEVQSLKQCCLRYIREGRPCNIELLCQQLPNLAEDILANAPL